MGLALEDKTRNRLRRSFRVISGPRHKGVHKAVMSPPQARKAIKDSLVEIVDGPPSERQIEEMWRYFNNACAFCGGKLVREDRKGHYDHLVPISRGGLNHISNRVLVSWKCNGDRKRETNWEEHDDSLELSRLYSQSVTNESSPGGRVIVSTARNLIG